MRSHNGVMALRRVTSGEGALGRFFLLARGAPSPSVAVGAGFWEMSRTPPCLLMYQFFSLFSNWYLHIQPCRDEEHNRGRIMGFREKCRYDKLLTLGRRANSGLKNKMTQRPVVARSRLSLRKIAFPNAFFQLVSSLFFCLFYMRKKRIRAARSRTFAHTISDTGLYTESIRPKS